MIETTASEETTTILYDGEDTSQVSDNDTNAETKDTLTRPTTTASTVNPTKEEREYYSMYFASNSSVEYHMTTPLPRNETTSTKDQASERVTVTRPVQTTGICNTSESTVYEQGTIKPSSVILSNMTSRQIPASPDSVKGLSNFTRPVDHFYESSFVSATSMADAFSTTSMNSGRSTFQSYQMSHIVESSLTTATDQTIEMDYSATRSSSKLLDRSQEGLLMSFKTSSEPLASTSPINVFSSVKPSALSSSHTQFQYSTSLYQRLKNDSIRGSAIWERSEEGLYETTVRVLETTSGSMKEGISRFIDVSKVVSDSRNKTDFATLGVITPTHTHVMGSVSVSDGQLDNQSTKAEENVSLFTSYIPFKASSFVNLSHSYNTKAHPRTAENQPVSQTQKYAITMDKGLTASFTLPSISNTRSSTDSMNTATNTKTMQNSGHSTVGLYDDISDYDYYYDYPSTVSMSPERVSSSPLHSTIISQPTQVINVSRSIPRDRNSTYRDSSYVTDTISPTKSTNIIMSDDIKIQKVDTESINRSSRENPKQGEQNYFYLWHL